MKNHATSDGPFAVQRRRERRAKENLPRLDTSLTRERRRLDTSLTDVHGNVVREILA